MLTLVNDDDVDMPPLTNKSNPGRNRVGGAWQRQLENDKAESEKAEPIIKDRYGNITSVTKTNSQTHQKMVLSKETIKQLMEYGRKDEWTLVTDSFDEIIVRLLHQVQKRNRRD